MALYGLDDDDVVISGISATFPGAPNFADFSFKLSESLPMRASTKIDVPVGFIGELTEYGRLLANKHTLDTTFFGVAKPVAATMTYLTRKNYSKAFEALLDAGLHPTDCENIASHLSSVSFICDGEITLESLEGSTSNYGTTGRSRAMEINRVSFHLGATGPSYSGDCGFLGGMQNMKVAYDEIKNNRADLAILCGGNTFVDTKTEIQFNDMGWLSKDGKTRVFDNDASGYFRSECTITYILQRAKTARRIYAKINDIMVKSIPAEARMTKQSRKNWEILFRDFYSSSQIPIEKISYLEAYGSGIKHMDTEELNAVTSFFCENRDEPLHVGSVKSIVGHCEGGADFASIAKAIVCFESGFIPANAHYSSPNQNIEGLVNGKIQVVNSKIPLPENALIALSGWSFASLYGHMVLSGFNKPKEPVVLSIPRLVPLTARTSEHLLQTIHTMESAVFDPEYYAFVTDVFRSKLNTFLGRGYVILPKKEHSISLAQADEEQRRPLWFVFSGMGSQWTGMGKGLLQLPITRDSLLKSHRVLEPHGVDLMKILTTSDPEIFGNILHSFVGISAIQIALVDLMRALKLEPDGIIGHSLGELGCAYCDGTLTAEQMLLCSYYRGRASIETPLIKGYMAAIGKGYAQIKDILPEGVEVACHNSSTSCTISGPADIVSEYVKKLEAEGVFARTVNVANIAYHSRYIQPAAPLLYQYLKKMIPNPVARSKKWVSTSVPEMYWDKNYAKYSSAEYHTNNFTSQVLFEEGSQHIPENACVVELAPHGLLQAILKRSMGPKALNMSLTNRDAKDPLVFLLEAIGKIFIAGYDLDINALYPSVEYPVSRGTLGIQPLLHWVEDENDIRWENNDQKLAKNIRRDLHACDSTKMGYQIDGKNIFPLSVYMNLADRLSTQYVPSLDSKLSTTFQDVRIHNPTVLSVEYDDTVEASLLRGENIFEIATTKGDRIVDGKILWQDKEDEVPAITPLFREAYEIQMTLNKDELYSWFRKRGYVIPPDLQGLTSLSITKQGAIGRISNGALSYAAIEGIFQILMFDAYNNGRKIVLPSVIQKMVIFHREQLDTDDGFEVIFDRTLDTLYSSKFFVSGVQMKEFSSSPSSLIFHTIDMVPFEKPAFESSREFIRFCCNIIERTKKRDEEIKVLELVDEPSDLKDNIESSLRSAQVLIKKAEEATAVTNGFDLVVCNSRDLNQVALNASGFILVQSHSPITMPANCAQVSKFECEKSNQLWLLKKKIVLNGERDFIVIPETKENLINELRNRRGKSSALLVGFEEPVEGFAQYQESIESQVDIKLKWLFILDKDAPEFNVMTDFYQEQLKQGLATNVLLKGKWHHIYKRKLEGNLDDFASNRLLDLVTDTAADKIPMMGIKKANNCPVLDPILSWPMPSSWSEEDAQFVPSAYSMAYHCLIVIADLIDFDRVLVTNAVSREGQAAVAVALTKAGRVFVSVGSTEEATQIKNLFPSINDEDVVFHTDPHMNQKLRFAVGENYPNVIYNLLDGCILEDYYENIATFSNIFHFGREDIAKNTQLNMAKFMRKVSLYLLSRENIFLWSDAEKKVIKGLVSEGIKTGTVRPLVGENSFTTKERRKKFTVFASGCYVIIGDDSDYHLDIADWLAEKGAKKIYICNPSFMNCSQYQQQVLGIKTRRNSCIETCDELGLKNATTERSVNANFFVHLAEHARTIDVSLITDMVESERTLIVTMSKTEEQFSKIRNAVDNRAEITNIIWNVDNVAISRSLDSLAPYFGRHSTISVNRDMKLNDSRLSASFIQQFLPDNLDSYHRLGMSLKSLADFIEVPTLCPRFSDKSTLCPIFVIPGVEDDPIESVDPVLKNILYPAFVAQIPHNSAVPMQKIASSLVPIMKKVSPGNTYNLVGISAGAPIAIEMARLLEEEGSTVATLIVDNPLEPLRSFVRSTDLEAEILLSLKSNKIDSNDAMIPWPENLQRVLSSMDLTPDAEKLIKEAACYVRYRFSAVLTPSFPEKEIKGPLTVLRSQDHAIDYNYNKLCLMHKTVNVPIKHTAFIQSRELSNFINQSAINDEMVVKSVHWSEFEDFLASSREF